jgi:hypothetical protein
MALFYVTGLSGTGKSAVRGELQARGYADWVTSNEFGQAPEELALILRLHDSYEAAYRGYGAVIIAAPRPLADVVDQVLAATLTGTSPPGVPSLARLSSRPQGEVVDEILAASVLC